MVPWLASHASCGGDLGGVHLRPGRVSGQLQADLVEAAVPGRISWTYHGHIMGISWEYTSIFHHISIPSGYVKIAIENDQL